jgi:hypothetical protein
LKHNNNFEQDDNDENMLSSLEDEKSSLDSISSIESKIDVSNKTIPKNNSLLNLKIPLLDLSKTYYEEEERRFHSLRKFELEKRKNKGKKFFRQSNNKGNEESSLFSSRGSSSKRPNTADLSEIKISDKDKEINVVDTFYTLLNPSPPVPMLSARPYLF